MQNSHPKNPRLSIHQFIGNGPVAELLLWRRRYANIFVLITSTLSWLIINHGGCSTPLSFFSNFIFFLVVVLFFWAKSASLLNRPFPSLPDVEVSDEVIEDAANRITVWTNRALAVAYDIVICGNLRLVFQVALLLWLISIFGNLVNLVTVVYIGIILALSVPVLYEKHPNRVHGLLLVMFMLVNAGYNKLNKAAFRKIPVTLYNKKSQ